MVIVFSIRCDELVSLCLKGIVGCDELVSLCLKGVDSS
jgi:hypothetical protein